MMRQRSILVGSPMLANAVGACDHVSPHRNAAEELLEWLLLEYGSRACSPANLG